MYQVFSANVECFYDEKIFSERMRTLSDEGKEKVLSYRGNEDKARSLGASLLLEYVFEKMVGEKHPTLIQGQEGKPYLKEYPDLFFNVSHSGDYVVCVVADQEVGVDIQQHKSVGKRFAERFFCEEENKYLAVAEGHEEGINRFFQIWTRKESYVKFLGTGMKEDFRKLNTLFGHDVSFVEYDTIPGYSITVCLLAPEQRVNMVSLDL